MRLSTLTLLVAMGALLPPTAAAGQAPTADHLFRRGSIAFSVYGGGGAFTTLHRIPDATGSGSPVEIAAQTTSAIAGEAMWWLSPALGVRLHASFLPSRFDVHRAGTESTLSSRDSAADSAVWRGVNVWIADVSALVRPPFTLGRVAPYAVLGAGLVSYRPRGDEHLPPGVEAAFGTGAHTAAAAAIGVGAMVPLQRERLLLSFALTNHLTRPLVEGELSTTSHVRLLAGITVPVRVGH